MTDIIDYRKAAQLYLGGFPYFRATPLSLQPIILVGGVFIIAAVMRIKAEPHKASAKPKSANRAKDDRKPSMKAKRYRAHFLPDIIASCHNQRQNTDKPKNDEKLC